MGIEWGLDEMGWGELDLDKTEERRSEPCLEIYQFRKEGKGLKAEKQESSE